MVSSPVRSTGNDPTRSRSHTSTLYHRFSAPKVIIDKLDSGLVSIQGSSVLKHIDSWLLM
jgi:hypothetical protein